MVVSEMGDRWSPHAAGAGSSQTHGQQSHLGIPVKHGADQRDHDADGAPKEVPVAKPMKQATMKITAGRNFAKAAGVGHNALHEGTHLQTIVTAQAAQGPSEAEDQDGGDHLDEAIGNGLHGLLEGDEAAQPVVHERKDQCNDGTQAQAGTGAGVGEAT